MCREKRVCRESSDGVSPGRSSSPQCSEWPAPRVSSAWPMNWVCNAGCCTAGAITCRPAALRRAGRPPRADAAAIEAPIAPADVSDPAEARRRIEELERKIGQQQLELDFFRAALRHVKEPRPQRPSVPMKVRHPTPGNLHLWARKDDLAYAHAPDRQRRGDRRRQERRP